MLDQQCSINDLVMTTSIKWLQHAYNISFAFRDDTTMPSRKFSVNSQHSVSSQKTSGSSSNGTIGCRRTASVHQINELYTALNDLIYSPPKPHRRYTGDSVVSTKSNWSSESNLLEYGTSNLPPRVNSEGSRLRPARSVSCVSSKSCFASIATTKKSGMVAQIVAKNSEGRSRSTDSQKSVYSKIKSKFRVKKLPEKQKSKQPKKKESIAEANACVVDGRVVSSVDDLLELLNTKTDGKDAAKEKRKIFKTFGRTKAHSFDSDTAEPRNPRICVHQVSSKLRTWYTTAASRAASLEDEARSRAESSVTASSEDILDSSEPGQRIPYCYFESSTDYETLDNDLESPVVGDFDASSSELLDFAPMNTKSQVISAAIPTNYESKQCVKALMSDPSLVRSPSSYENTDSVSLRETSAGSRANRKMNCKSESRCDLVRRLSLTVVEDILAARSASYEQITRFGRSRLNRDLSKRKVQQWLEDLHADEAEKQAVMAKIESNQSAKAFAVESESEPVASVEKFSGEYNEIETTDEKATDNATADTGVVENGNLDVCTKQEQQPHSQPLFYIPNIGPNGDEAPLNMLIRF